MSRKVVWSKYALQDYSQNIDYLIQEWSLSDAKEFVDNVGDIIRIITKMPESSPFPIIKISERLLCANKLLCHTSLIHLK